MSLKKAVIIDVKEYVGKTLGFAHALETSKQNLSSLEIYVFSTFYKLYAHIFQNYSDLKYS